jgi:GntR family transcriptional repressor for pyruvate dehydrogenase complex
MPHVQLSEDSKEDVTVRVLTTFKRLISEGTLKLGSRLPAERELAEQFQVSRNSLRQGLKVLETIGVISQRVGDGTYVTEAADSILGEPLNFLILLNGISLQELMEARMIVEPELAARAAERATPKTLADLRNEMDAMKASEADHKQLSRHDLNFHSIIFDAAGNRVCSMLFTVVHQSLHSLIEVTSYMVPVKHTLQFHRRIYNAIGQANPKAARKRMQEHLLDATVLLSRASDERRNAHLQNRISELAQPARLRVQKR